MIPPMDLFLVVHISSINQLLIEILLRVEYIKSKPFRLTGRVFDWERDVRILATCTYTDTSTG